jgi:hypothetical protein
MKSDQGSRYLNGVPDGRSTQWEAALQAEIKPPCSDGKASNPLASLCFVMRHITRLTKSVALEAAEDRPVVKCHRSMLAMRLLTRLRCPRADSRESIRRDSGDVAGDVAHRGRRKFGLRSEVERSQALQ